MNISESPDLRLSPSERLTIKQGRSYLRRPRDHSGRASIQRRNLTAKLEPQTLGYGCRQKALI